MSLAQAQMHCGNPTPKAPDKRTPGQRKAAERKAARQKEALTSAGSGA